MWKAVNYEVQGRGHVKTSTPCQDKTLYSKIMDVHFIGLADGAGSAILSHFGAEVVNQAASEFISSNFDSLINNEDGKVVKVDILNYLLAELKKKSEELGCTLKDLASTFLMVAIKGDKFLVCHIGDGLVGYLKDSNLKVISTPENGEYANSTVFVTSKSALPSMKLYKGSLTNVSGFILMSDGTAESFYNKQKAELAPVLIKILQRNAILERNKMFEIIKKNFDSIIVNNTHDDCSIAMLSRPESGLCDYFELTDKEKCEILSISFGTQCYKKQLQRYDTILFFLSTFKTIDQVSKHIYLKRKYTIKYLNRLIHSGLIIKSGNKFKM